MPGYTELAFEALGTYWKIDLHQSLGDDSRRWLSGAIDQRIAIFDKAYSRFRTDSLVTAISQKAGTYELPGDGYKLLQFYEQLYRLTSGLVTPLIGQLMADAGYDAAYSMKQKLMRQPPNWEDIIKYDKHSITIQQPVLLDFGAAGKGYLVDLIDKLLTQAGISSFTINASGDILHRSVENNLLTVGLENPNDVSEVIGIVKLDNRSLCASSGAKRKWGTGYNHVMNPHTLQSVRDVLATWVIADDTMTADGLATALFFTSPQELKGQFSFAYAVLDKDTCLAYSKDFPIKLFETSYERH